MPLNLGAIGKKIGPITKEYGWKDVVLYALSVGAGFDELEYVYEKRLKVIPSFAITAIFAQAAPRLAVSAGINLAGLLHGEHELILHSPIPPEGGTLTTEGEITHIYDKGAGRGALVIVELDTYHSDGQKLFTNIATLFARLDGGFGGQDQPEEAKLRVEFPDRVPDFEEPAHPTPHQPLLYRLSGDTFALHVDPDFARASGFEKPIMHGQCTQGYACRAVIKHLFPGEPERLTRFRHRFSRPLYPGVPIKTQIWKTGEGTAVFKTLNAQTEEVVIDRGVVEWMSREEMEKRGGIRFDGRVAIVTGAGRGLGRVYALELAKRGAKVVVNYHTNAEAAQEVVEAIKAQGGQAVAVQADVGDADDAKRLIKTAQTTYGGLDILVNNAGILRDKTFAKMTPEMWSGVLAVHLQGAYNVTQPAFRAMRENGYGRIVMTTSTAGLFGSFGQTNYSAAKMGLVGMMNTLKLEGKKYNIKVNTVAPLAGTRLTKDVIPPDMFEKLKPEFVAPLVLYLCAEQCPVTGRIYKAGMGYYGRVAVVSGPGTWVGSEDEIPTPEAVAARWKEITALGDGKEYADANAALMDMLTPPTP